MADTVLNLLSAAAEHGAEHAEPMAFGFVTPGMWVALAMTALILVAIWQKVPGLVASMLDKKIEGIKHMLDEAATLRKEAEALKAEYQQKIADAEKLAAEFKTAATHEAQMIIEKAEADAVALVARREKMAEEKISAAERNAIAELRAKAAAAAATAARGLIAQNHSAQADKTLVDEAIAGI